MGGDVQVASFNVFNYFTTLKSENSNARGAANAAQFEIQKSKIVAAINGLDAEIVVAHGDRELDQARRLARRGAGRPGRRAQRRARQRASGTTCRTPDELNDSATTDFITNAIIYKKDAVETVGDSLDRDRRDRVGQRPRADRAGVRHRRPRRHGRREPLQVEVGARGRWSGAGRRPGLLQRRPRRRRRTSLKGFTEEIEEATGSSDILLIGDFNAYAQGRPDRGLHDGRVERRRRRRRPPSQYTYTFDGELGSLDHVLASPSLAASITGAGVWSINSPEWSDRGYAFGATEAGTPFRSSDHDPIIVGVSSEIPPVSIDVVTINDFHGRIEADGAAAGAAVVAGAVKQFREENPNTIFAGAGDLIGASTFTSFINDDNPTIDALNAAGLDVSAAGNHEFDQGWEDLRDRVQDRADWEYISSNVFVTETGEPALAPAWVEGARRRARRLRRRGHRRTSTRSCPRGHRRPRGAQHRRLGERRGRRPARRRPVQR